MTIYWLNLLTCFTLKCTVATVSEQYNVPARTINAILAVESTTCKYTRSRVAWGCMQLHRRTVKSLNMDMRVYTDFKFNIDAGVKYLTSTKHICEYNVGTFHIDKLPACMRYLAKLRKHGVEFKVAKWAKHE